MIKYITTMLGTISGIAIVNFGTAFFNTKDYEKAFDKTMNQLIILIIYVFNITILE